MTRLLALVLASSGLAGPAVAQNHQDHAGHAEEQQSQPAPQEHSEHLPGAPPAADPHAGHTPAPAAVGAAAAAEPNAHAGHSSSADTTDIPAGPPPAPALAGPEHAADTVFGEAAMAASRAVLLQEHGDLPAHKVLVGRLEARVHDGTDGYSIDAEGWYGGDVDKLWLKGQLEGDFGGDLERVEAQVLWSHAIAPFFDLQAGVRLDLEPEGRAHAVVGVQGLVPYWIEIDAAAFLSEDGHLTAHFEAEHDVRITQRLILQPQIELGFSLQDNPQQRLGAGLTGAEAGLRLRYEIVPQFAPYVGLRYERAFGDTRQFRAAAGEHVGGWSFLAGLRAWF